MIPAVCPPPYQPSAPPRKLATNAPATPSPIVIQMPPGSLPGMTSLASAPAMRPTRAVQIRFMEPSFSWATGKPRGHHTSAQVACGPTSAGSASILPEQPSEAFHHLVERGAAWLVTEQLVGKAHEPRLRLGDVRVLTLEHGGEPALVETS